MTEKLGGLVSSATALGGVGVAISRLGNAFTLARGLALRGPGAFFQTFQALGTNGKGGIRLAFLAAKGGAALGASIGALGGPVGVAVGGIVGGIVGGMVGSGIGSKIGDVMNTGISALFHW